MLQKIDKQWIGFVLGMIVPIIAFFGIYFFGFKYKSLISFYEMILARGFFSQILSLAVIPNVAVFFIFIWLNKLSAAKGVLAATIVMALLVFGLKIFA
ncbi:MAG: hypothetical protein HXX16_12690 [Bacteroidales bacterium]|nr:hypothetical protein [Bacteroidales bacterium]